MESETGPVQSGCNSSCPLHDFTPHPKYHLAQILLRPTGPLPNQQVQAARLYSPIKDWQTRIVKLYPGSLGKKLLVKLLVVDLILADGVVRHDRQEKLSFEALSYGWGAPVFDSPITINGTIYPVTANLYAALQRLRYKRLPRYVWIDALCINQYDAKERSIQIQNMLNIFKKANTVLVWLGTCHDDTMSSLDSVERLLLGIEEDDDSIWKALCTGHTHVIYQGFKALLNRPWYSRLWVRQEIWAARDIVVFCGIYAFRWPKVQQAARLVRIFGLRLEHKTETPFHHHLETVFPYLRQADPITLAQTEYPKLKPLIDDLERCSTRFRTEVTQYSVDLVRVIQRTVGCQCSDKRDRIYGVLGMTSVLAQERFKRSSEAPTLTVNYDLTTAQVFADAAIFVMQSDMDCTLLTLNATFGGTVDGEELPSWCPDWSQPFGDGDYFSNRLRSRIDVKKMYLSHSELHVVGYQTARVTSLISTPSRPQWTNVVEVEIVFTSERKTFGYSAAGPVKEGDIIVDQYDSRVSLILRSLGADQFQFLGTLQKAQGRREEWGRTGRLFTII